MAGKNTSDIKALYWTDNSGGKELGIELTVLW